MTDSPSNPPRRRWFRVSLRALMVLVLLVGGVVGWQAHTIRTQRAAIEAARREGAQLTFDFSLQEILPRNPGWGPVYPTEPAAPAWLRRYLGDELFQTIVGIELDKVRSPARLTVMARGARLQRLRIKNVGPGSLEPGLLRSLDRLETLDLLGPGVLDAELAEVGDVPTLQTIRINSSAGTDAGFARLASLPEVRELQLISNHQLTDAGVGRLLAGLPALRALDLRVEQGLVTRALAALAQHHPDLTTLTIYSPESLTVADCAAIGQLAQLRFLWFSSVALPAAGVVQLRRLGHLTQLIINGSLESDASLADLVDLAALEVLRFERFSFGPDADLAPLARLPRLYGLNLGGTGISDAGMRELARSGRFTELNLSANPAITDATLRALADAPNLQALGVAETNVTVAGIQALVAARPGLRVGHHFSFRQLPQVVRAHPGVGQTPP